MVIFHSYVAMVFLLRWQNARAENAALPGVRERHLGGPEASRQTLHPGTGQGPGRFDAKSP